MVANVKYLLIWINIGSMVLAGYRHYAMDSICGTVLSFDTERILGATLSMNLTHMSTLQGHCDVVVVSRSNSMFSHLHVYVSEFVSDVSNCSTYSLAVKHGNSQNATIQLTDIPEICDDTHNKISYTTWKNYLQFTFIWNASLPQSYIQIVLNAYSPEDCPDEDDDEQTECKNDRCIPTSLACQDYNPCGDYTDCSEQARGLSYTVKILYSVGSVIVLIFILTIVYNVCFKAKWSEWCSCEDGNCCRDFCACVFVLLRNCFGACVSSIKTSGSKIKGCCCRCCCKNTVSTANGTGSASQTVDRSACAASNRSSPPPYSLRPFSPPPTYSVAMRNAPPPQYTEVFDISIEPTSEAPPAYELIARDHPETGIRS